MAENFKFKAYTKAELAALYTPSGAPTMQSRDLNRWIQKNEKLKAELETIGYRPRRHCFLKREVELIVKYLGEP